jgi:protein-S-isoprenylcysteine O-methyltransferase Ste14
MLGSGAGPSQSTRKRTLGTVVLGVLAVLAALAGILFLSAGRIDWIQAWAFVAAYGAFLLFYGVWGLRRDPGQLEERSKARPNVKAWDKVILRAYTALLIALLVVAGLDAGRFRWAPAPAILQALGWIGLAKAGFVIWWAAASNPFLSRWVRIQDDRGQQAVATGPYRWVRHPMYVGIIVLMLGMPLALGSMWALLPGVLIGILFVIRTALEDRTLLAELPGYQEYARQVRYRLLPGIW